MSTNPNERREDESFAAYKERQKKLTQLNKYIKQGMPKMFWNTKTQGIRRELKTKRK